VRVEQLLDGGKRNVVVDDKVLFHTVDRIGVGHWSKPIEVKMPLPRGRYIVRVAARVPGKVLTHMDGSTEPFETCQFQDVWTVQ
jgi:hypothetical protein